MYLLTKMWLFIGFCYLIFSYNFSIEHPYGQIFPFANYRLFTRAPDLPIEDYAVKLIEIKGKRYQEPVELFSHQPRLTNDYKVYLRIQDIFTHDNEYQKTELRKIKNRYLSQGKVVVQGHKRKFFPRRLYLYGEVLEERDVGRRLKL